MLVIAMLFRSARTLTLAVLLLAVTFASHAQSEEECNRDRCFGIDWNKVSVSKLAELDPFAVSIQGRQPIHYASYNCSSTATFISLFERGADPNIVDPQNGLTPLQIAILSCKAGKVKLLLEFGADPEALTPDGGGNTIHLALRARVSPDIMRALFESEADLDRLDEYGNAPLVYFVANDNPEMMHAILDAGADPNVSDRRGHTVAHYAASRGLEDLLSKLRVLGADLGAVAESGVTPLHLAADRGLTPKQVGIFRNVNPNVFDDTGRAPIHYAASKSDAPTMIALAALGADTNLLDALGETPFHYALRHNKDMDVIGLLLGWGADPNLPSADGEAPALIATRFRDDDALGLMIRYGADLAAVDHNGRTLLHHAIIDGNAQAAAGLIENGADVFAADILGDTPASLADKVQIEDPAASLIAAKVEERNARMRLQQERMRLREEELSEIRDRNAEEALQRHQARQEQRARIDSVAEGEMRLNLIENRKEHLQKQLDHATKAGNQQRIDNFTEELEREEESAVSVAERIEQIQEEARQRRENDRGN